MSTSAPIVDLSPQVRDAFDEGCRAVFKTHAQRPMLEYKSRDLLLRFAAHYQHLSALPRRMRRTLERRWKCTLSAIALLMTLGQAPAFAAIIAGRTEHAAGHQCRRQVLADRSDRQCQQECAHSPRLRGGRGRRGHDPAAREQPAATERGRK